MFMPPLKLLTLMTVSAQAGTSLRNGAGSCCIFVEITERLTISAERNGNCLRIDSSTLSMCTSASCSDAVATRSTIGVNRSGVNIDTAANNKPKTNSNMPNIVSDDILSTRINTLRCEFFLIGSEAAIFLSCNDIKSLTFYNVNRLFIVSRFIFICVL